MANIILSWVNHVQDSNVTISASGANANMPVENIADPRAGKRWRSNAVSDYGQADFAADKSIGIVALRFPRDVTLPSGTVRHYLDADGGTAGAGAVDDSTAISIGLTDGYAYHSWQPSATRSARYWRFLYAATGVSVVDTGIAWAGETWSPDVNISYDYTDAWEDLSAGSQGVRSGSVFWDVRPRRRKIAFSIDVLSETERKTVREMNRIAGISSQVLAIIRPDDAATETIIGTLTQSSPIRHPYFNISSAVFEIQESL